VLFIGSENLALAIKKAFTYLEANQEKREAYQSHKRNTTS
jgi:hypothetical protein